MRRASGDRVREPYSVKGPLESRYNRRDTEDNFVGFLGDNNDMSKFRNGNNVEEARSHANVKAVATGSNVEIGVGTKGAIVT